MSCGCNGHSPPNRTAKTVKGGTWGSCPTNQYVWNDPSDLEEHVVSAEIHNELKDAVVAELLRRQMDSAVAELQGVNVGSIINNERLKNLRDELNSISAITIANCTANTSSTAASCNSHTVDFENWTFTTELLDANLEDGDYIQGEQYKAIRDRLNTLADDCVCNCNYCTCNCNYCTCNCNYSCTCNCNYSDFDLKYDIEYAA